MVVLGLLAGLIACIGPIAILVLIISAIVKRNKEDKGNFEESIRNVYVYIILIVTFLSAVWIPCAIASAIFLVSFHIVSYNIVIWFSW